MYLEEIIYRPAEGALTDPFDRLSIDYIVVYIEATDYTINSAEPDVGFPVDYVEINSEDLHILEVYDIEGDLITIGDYEEQNLVSLIQRTQRYNDLSRRLAEDLQDALNEGEL